MKRNLYINQGENLVVSEYWLTHNIGNIILSADSTLTIIPLTNEEILALDFINRTNCKPFNFDRLFFDSSSDDDCDGLSQLIGKTDEEYLIEVY